MPSCAIRTAVRPQDAAAGREPLSSGGASDRGFAVDGWLIPRGAERSSPRRGAVSALRDSHLAICRRRQPAQIAGKVYDGADCFAESLRVFTEMGTAGERARTPRAWARYEMERGDREHSERMWQEARDVFERLGMDLEILRMSFPVTDLSRQFPGFLEGANESDSVR